MAAMKDDSIRVREWETGLPSTADLTPISHSLISRVLARAFCIPPSAAGPNSDDVLQASQATLQLLQQKQSPAFSLPSFDPYSSYEAAAGGGRLFGAVDEGPDEDRGEFDSLRRNREESGPRSVARAIKNPVFGKGVWEGDNNNNKNNSSNSNGQDRDGGGGSGTGNSGPDLGQSYYWPAQGVMPGVSGGQYGPLGSDQGRYGGLETGSESKGASLDKPRKVADNESEDVDSADGPDGNAARTLKRPRLVWTPQLHKRFVDAVGHLGIKNAVPKTIMQLMNVEGLTRENVASHLQKYRLYLKRMQGLSNEGPSASDPLFASTPLPPNLTSPHFFSSHHHSRAENGASGPPFPPAAPPIPRAQGNLPPGVMGPGPMGLGALHHFGGFEHHPFGIGLPRAPASQRPPHSDEKPYGTEHREHLVNVHSSQPGGPGSPPHRVLTLFPPSGH